SSSSADTAACSSPERTSAVSARAPSARPRASSRIDLPAPVSPVSTPSPESNSSSSFSTSTTLWMASCLSISPAAQALLRPGRLLGMPLLISEQQSQRLAVPIGPGVIPPQHGGGLVGFGRRAQREIGFDEPLERFRRMARRLILVHHFAETQARREPV